MAATATVQATTVAPIAASTPMKKKAPATKTKSAAAAHPSTAVMVISAVKELNEKKGSSLSAIKKYMATNYKVDSAKLAPFIRKFLKAAVVKGALVQTNGTGAMGHFRLPVDAKKKPVAAKKPSAAAASKKKVAAKKPAAKAAASAGTPKKRKLAAKKAPTAAEPAAKKSKAVAAKPRKSLVKAKKPVVASKPPKAKKASAVTKVKAPKKK
ncbi:PREDICTED: histone H1A, sperm-like [Diuraphis noxia]|uniref:histone H1A, sperm-like n=1 Tax=Diuraphis noxia TaxID=143948 RepID=UPI00076370B8|nr:PREDICTED: histone H1A, sperm-like [Diuraphis noxia]